MKQISKPIDKIKYARFSIQKNHPFRVIFHFFSLPEKFVNPAVLNWFFKDVRCHLAPTVMKSPQAEERSRGLVMDGGTVGI